MKFERTFKMFYWIHLVFDSCNKRDSIQFIETKLKVVTLNALSHVFSPPVEEQQGSSSRLLH